MKQLKIPSRQRVLVTLALLVLILPVLPLTASAGHPLGTPFPIRAEGEVEVNPAIAYNSQDQQYLVVLWNDRPGCDDIRAERVTADGRSLGGKWIAAGCPAEHRYPDVAYNSKGNEYLVVWVEESGGINYIKLQRLSAEAQLLGGAVTIVQDSNPLLHPAVAYAFTSDKYLVVWEDTFPGGSDIIGRVISAGGQPEPSWVVISQDPGGQPRQQPDLAYNRHANGFLVVWQEWDGTASWDIYGQLVNGDGGIPPSFLPIQIAWYIESCTAPAVAAIPTAAGAYKYLAVWEAEVNPGERNIYGKLVEENGTPDASILPIAASSVDESAPAVAGDEAGQRYLVTWRHPLGVVDVPIRGRAVSAGGTFVYDMAEFGGPTAGYPAVASGSAGTFLVAWQDKSVFATNTDILGQFWGNRVHLPMVVRNHQ